MNIIEIKNRIDSLIDRTKSPRFFDRNYMDAINNAIQDDFKDRVENIKQNRKYSFESSEEIMRELYTLVTGPVNITPVNVPGVGDTVPYPNDYRFFGRLFTTVDGITTYARPMMFKQQGPRIADPFLRAKPSKPYYQELSGAFLITHNGSSFTNASFVYVRYPAIVSLGQESDKVTTGGTLQVSTQYIVYDDAVYNGTFYQSGKIFTTGLVTTLTSGIVIPTSVIVNCDMPVNIQDDLCKKAAEVLMLSVKEFDKSQFLEKESEKA